MDPTQDMARPPNASNASATGLPPAAGQDSALYNQIAGQDLDPQVIKKKGKSPLMALMVLVMRFTLWFDSVKRTHERVFHVLGVLWALFMSVLYLSGILVLIFALYNRLQLPIYLEDQLRARDVQFESAEYSMDRIVVHHLKDKNQTYTIDTMVIYSTFTDLLQKRIRLVTFDGLSLFVDTNTGFDAMQDIPQLLTQVQNPTRGRLDLTINAITINNAKLIFKNQQIDIPISFSMEGMYGDQTQIVIPITIKQPSLQAKATLAIGGSNDYPEWTLSVSEGMITLPRSSPENITGDFKIALDHKQLDTISADFKMGYGTLENHVTGHFRKNTDSSSLTGQLVWDRNNLTEPDLSSNLSFNISDFTLLNAHNFQIKGPLAISSTRFNTSYFGWTGLSASLKVDMLCNDWSNCTVSFKDKATILMQEAWVQTQHQIFRSTDEVRFDLQPKDEALRLQEREPYITFNFPVQGFNFAGVSDSTKQATMIQSTDVTVAGSFADDTSDTNRLALNAQGLTFETTDFSMHQAALSVDNLLIPNSNLHLQANSVQLKDLPLLSNDFRLNLAMQGNQATARLDFTTFPLSVQLAGQLSLTQKAFSGQVKTTAFDLKDLTVPVQSLWPTLPADLTNISGQVVAAGQLVWLGTHNIAGPLNLGLKDVSFDMDHTRVQGMNAVLTFDALQPVITKQNQHLYIQSVNSFVPFNDLETTFQLDGQNLRLNQFKIAMAGIPLELPTSVIATKNANALLYLKNDQSIPAKNLMSAFHLADLEASAGTANLSIPVEIQNGTLNLPNATLKLQNVLLQRHSTEYPALFANSDNYFIRSGQVILDKNHVLQLVFNGRLLPTKVQKDVQFNNIQLPDDFFNIPATSSIPHDIELRLNALFGH